MPRINLDIPKNSRFTSSLNEIDIAMKSILLHCMRLADPRTKTAKPNVFTSNENEYLWDKTRVFQVDDMTTEDIFDTYLLRKEINGLKGTDVSYPLLAYKQENIDTVFWGTGNRYRQNEVAIVADPNNWEIGDEVAIKDDSVYRGTRGEINTIEKAGCTVKVNGQVITERIGVRIQPKVFPFDVLTNLNPEKAPATFKAKAITGKYFCVVLADNRDEIQYIRDRYILRVADGNIWWQYKSPVINNEENQIFTVFGIPNIDRYPVAADKLKNKGYIYGTSFYVDIWAALTDTPLPAGFIEDIRMSITVEPDGRSNRIIINGSK